MFHVSNNKRAQESATRIREGLEQLIDRHGFNAISVSALCAEAGISRPTFYRLFDTPIDVIHWYCDQQSTQLCCAMRKNHDENPFLFNLRYILTHPEALELARKAGRTDIADAAFFRNIEPVIKSMYPGRSEEELRISGVVISALITSSYQAWIESGKHESVEQFYDRILRVLQQIH